MGDTPIFLKWIMSQINAGYSPLVLIVGRQRVGKTALALYWAWLIGQLRGHPFNIKTDMFFSVLDFATMTKQESNKTWVIDEAGVSLDPHGHAMLDQRVYSKIVQTQAYKSNVVFLVLPFARGIGKEHRDYVDVILSVTSRGTYKMEYIYKNYSQLNFRPFFKELFEMRYGIPLPPGHVWDEYKNNKQDEYKTTILNEQLEMLKTKMERKKGNVQGQYSSQDEVTE